MNIEQQKAFDLCVAGESVLITGQAGTGKTYTIGKICEEFNKQGRVYAVTASTGAAAVLIDGVTLHRWAGIGLGSKTAPALVNDIMRSPYPQARDHWRNTDCLIIDEVSMIDAELLDKLEYISRIIRKRDIPFGGLQIVLCGDFGQLPPVKGKGGFCFQANCWPVIFTKETQIALTQIVRQSDFEFRKALSEIRIGVVSPETQKMLRKRVGAVVGTDLIKPTVLLSNRIDVDSQNEAKLNELSGDVYEYQSIDKIEPYYNNSDKDEVVARMNRDMQPRETINLKVGAQVMLMVNYSDTLVNGSRGVVIGFHSDLPRVLFLDGSEMTIKRHVWRSRISDTHFFIRHQIPLLLAWISTIHRSQGCTLDCADVDISKCFEYGQAYVALSRVKSLEGMTLRNNDLSRIIANPVVRKYYKSLE